MNCEHCDKPVSRPGLHWEEQSSVQNGNVRVWFAWTCQPHDWRKRALEAEAKVVQLEATVRNLWETSNA